MNEQENKEIMQLTPQELAAQQALMAGEFTGFEKLSPQMLASQFLKICQDGTPEKQRGGPNSTVEQSSNCIPGLYEGMWFNNMTRKVYDKRGNSILIVPFFVRHSYLHWSEGLGALKGEYDDATLEQLVRSGKLIPCDDKPAWKEAGNPGCECGLNITVYCFLPDYPEEGIVPLSIKSTMLKWGKKWLSLANGMPITLPTGQKTKSCLYHYVWEFKAVEDKATNGKTFFNIGNEKGSGISLYGNIFKPEFQKLLMNLAEAKKAAELKKNEKLNYAASLDSPADADDEPIPTGFSDSDNPFLK